MEVRNGHFTVTALMAVVDEILEGAGFKFVAFSTASEWGATLARVYEDAYSIVCVAVYETWAELSERWVEDQASLVDMISKFYLRTDAKAWDGYLVLLTPSLVGKIDRRDAITIQRNTRYLRKLFADGDQLQSLADVRRTLLPLLPLEEFEALQSGNVLDTIPSLFGEIGIDERAVRVAITAFREERPIIAEIHKYISSKPGISNED